MSIDAQTAEPALSPAPALAPTTLPVDCRTDLRGGDRWYRVRPECLAFRAAAVVHAAGTADTHAVAEVLGVSVARAYTVLVSCVRRSHLYHLRALGGGRFASTSTTAQPLRSRSA